ncbi:hypothetical protein IFT69_14700 [Pseudomonas putida]|nr:hypothetical protein [Pseudomonas putida]
MNLHLTLQEILLSSFINMKSIHVYLFFTSRVFIPFEVSFGNNLHIHPVHQLDLMASVQLINLAVGTP